MCDRPIGPLCGSELGIGWIDSGTNCLSRSSAPGPLRVLNAMILGAAPLDPAIVKFNADHIYSTAPEAATKRAIDLRIMGGDYHRGHEISIDNETYLKRLIEIASKGKYSVGTSRVLQFFIIRGGAEGFLPMSMLGKNASNIVVAGSTTSGASSLSFRFDNNDLLVVFDRAGKLVSSARLERPLFITGVWSQKTADKVYNKWANKEVFIYKNSNFDIPYLGLGVEDGFRGKGATVDMHKQEATNGCIFIVDSATPAIDDSNLGAFEPKLIKAILAKTGINVATVNSRKIPLGVMRVIEII